MPAFKIPACARVTVSQFSGNSFGHELPYGETTKPLEKIALHRAALPALSLRRVNSVMDVLMQMGIDSERMSPSGVGESEPVAPNGSVEGRRLNRRVNIILD